MVASHLILEVCEPQFSLDFHHLGLCVHFLCFDLIWLHAGILKLDLVPLFLLDIDIGQELLGWGFRCSSTSLRDYLSLRYMILLSQILCVVGLRCCGFELADLLRSSGCEGAHVHGVSLGLDSLDLLQVLSRCQAIFNHGLEQSIINFEQFAMMLADDDIFAVVLQLLQEDHLTNSCQLLVELFLLCSLKIF